MDVDPIANADFPKLHEDILVLIFGNLETPDRKNVRLVCKEWYQICRRKIFTKEEAFYISHVHSLLSVSNILKKTTRDMWSFKFDYRVFDKLSHSFWENHGRKIESLHFHQCIFKPKVFQFIFTRCVNLCEFSAQDCMHLGSPLPYGGTDEPSNIFQSKQPIQRKNLTKLHIDSKGIRFNAADLHFLSCSFPKLQSLFVHLKLDYREGSFILHNVTELFKILETKLMLCETLHIRFPRSDLESPHTDFSSLFQLESTRLKYVSMPSDVFITNEQNLNSILKFKFWTSLKINWARIAGLDIAALFSLLHDNPTLEELELTWTPTNNSDFCILSTALVNSRLKSLSLNITESGHTLLFFKNLIWEASLSLENLANNYTVRKLSVTASKSTEFGSFFVKHFQGVEELSVKPANPHIIFEHQKNLKNLSICTFNVPRGTPTATKTSIENLEFLSVGPLFQNLFSTYQFPNLEYLVLEDFKKFDNELEVVDDMGEIYVPVALPIVANDENSDDSSDDEAYIADVLNVRGNQMPGTVQDTNAFIRKINSLMPHIFRKSPNLLGIEIQCRRRSFNFKALRVFFQSCRYFHSLRYISFYGSCCIKTEMEIVKREITENLSRCPSLRAAWVDIRKSKHYYFYDIITETYQFSKLSEEILTEMKKRDFGDNISLRRSWRNRR